MRVFPFLLLFPLAGCDTPPPVPALAELPTAAGANFNPANNGTIRGRVTWAGPIPTEAPIHAMLPPASAGVWADFANPLLPQVRDGGLANAVVSLIGVDPAKCGPWPATPATVVQVNRQLHIDTDRRRPVGLVRRSDTVQFRIDDDGYAMVRGRGAAFFATPFPLPARTAERRFAESGRVELSSGHGLFWASAALVVTDHPLYAITDDRGQFQLSDVPAGTYQMTVTVADWRSLRDDRNPEDGLVFRRTYRDPLVKRVKISVSPGATATADVVVSAADFAP